MSSLQKVVRFLASKNCENGSMTFEVIWIYYNRALNDMIMSYTI